MNDKQIAFIMCVNNDQYCNEAIRYINDLDVPKGYSIDVISIKEADSMAQGYNAAMQASDAKYKVYMHQDVFIVNKKFIREMLEVFENDEKIGMIGVIGTDKVPANGEWYSAWDCGKVRFFNGDKDCFFDMFSEVKAYKRALVIDGMIMVTQYDIPWREDIFDGWDFYDVSQSFEMFSAGYKAVIPKQESVWTYHDIGILSMKKYDYYKKLFYVEYKSLFKDMTIDIVDHTKRLEHIQSADKIADNIKQLVPKRCYKEIKEVLEPLVKIYLNNDLREIMALADIYVAEEESIVSLHSEWFYKDSWQEIYECYNDVRLIMIRIEHGKEDDRIELLREKVKLGIITEQAITMIADRLFEDSRKVRSIIFG